MSLQIRTGISNQTAGTSKSSTTSAIPQIPALQVGKVMGVVTTENTPSSKQFEKVGGLESPGTIFYLDYDKSKNIDPKLNRDDYLDRCDIAKPLFPQFCYYPLLGELVYIIELPSPASQIIQFAPQKYYINSINLWNDSQVNTQTANSKAPLGKYFVENPSVRNLLNYEGDHIIQGRKGNSIRFGTTVRVASNKNEWSDIGLEGYPITIISNGHAYDETKNYYLESINNEASSIYLTSNQRIPLKVEVKDPINPITLPPSLTDYVDSQAIINADRVVINSKKDDVMLFASTNIEISTNNIINLNAGKSVHINVKESNPLQSIGPNPKIILGTKYDDTPAFEPVLLGKQTTNFLLSLLTALDSFALALTATSTNAEGSPLAKIQGSADALQTQLKPLYDRLQKLLSNSTFTI
jgi:hypothetical protein